MPVFNGDDAYGWIYRAERYFDIQNIRDYERVITATLCMEGAALAWYRWGNTRTPFRSWEELKGRLLDRFQSTQGGDLYEQFLAISQRGTARDYVSDFEAMAGQLMNLPEQVLEATFMKGLKPELRTTLRIMQPSSLSQIMRLAITIEENRGWDRLTLYEGSTSRQPNLGLSNRGGGLVPDGTIGTSTVGDKKAPSAAVDWSGQFKRLSNAEVAEKRAKRLCFRCDERFSPGHRCSNPTLQVLLVPEGGDIEIPDEWGEFHLEDKVDV